ncbi:GNAT family N-acetyltransferase [Dokdonia ponticola]|uniref:GNAT family N-acetyltransferase n=1 Tax=Dokdonia ponticola TaxID=2041041 RepID=A0ABV9HXC8_9FLAO
MSGYSEFYNCWIYEEADRWCVGFWISGNYFFNSKNLTKEDVKNIKDKIDFKQFKKDGFHFIGNTQLIDKLSDHNSSFTLESFKERYFYSLKEIHLKSKFSKEVNLASQEDIQEIATLYQQYYQEEYNGNNNKELTKTLENFESLQLRKLIYSLKENDKVIGFCTIMTFLSPKPNMIGTIFIDVNFRNNGNGRHLLSFVVGEILKQNDELFLMTTKENISLNRMVESIGFRKCYEHSDRIIKNHE